MGLGKNGQKVFVRKSGANGVGLYKWSPGSSDKKAIKNSKHKILEKSSKKNYTMFFS